MISSDEVSAARGETTSTGPSRGRRVQYRHLCGGPLSCHEDVGAGLGDADVDGGGGCKFVPAV